MGHVARVDGLRCVTFYSSLLGALARLYEKDGFLRLEAHGNPDAAHQIYQLIRGGIAWAERNQLLELLATQIRTLNERLEHIETRKKKPGNLEKQLMFLSASKSVCRFSQLKGLKHRDRLFPILTFPPRWRLTQLARASEQNHE
jgi:hypothetical protein